MTICIVDTSIFCNVLDVPGRNEYRDEVLRTLREHITRGFNLLLPLATLYETGNHIAQASDGGLRRTAAERFSKQVRKAVDGQAPWRPMPLHGARELVAWLDEFPDSAMRGVGLADLSIIKIFMHQCELHRARRVFIWSFDAHLQGYDRVVG